MTSSSIGVSSRARDEVEHLTFLIFSFYLTLLGCSVILKMLATVRRTAPAPVSNSFVGFGNGEKVGARKGHVQQDSHDTDRTSESAVHVSPSHVHTRAMHVPTATCIGLQSMLPNERNLTGGCSMEIIGCPRHCTNYHTVRLNPMCEQADRTHGVDAITGQSCPPSYSSSSTLPHPLTPSSAPWLVLPPVHSHLLPASCPSKSSARSATPSVPSRSPPTTTGVPRLSVRCRTSTSVSALEVCDAQSQPYWGDSFARLLLRPVHDRPTDTRRQD